MSPGDHWYVMEYLLGKVKNDLKNANNAKNPDPVKVKRAEDMKARIEKLYDAHTNRVKVVKEMVSMLKQAMNPGVDGELFYQMWSIHDVIDGLSGGEIFDYQDATGDHVLDAGHFPGYYNMRKQDYDEDPRNYSSIGAQRSTRVEIFAQFYQFYSYQDKSAYKILAKLMPKSAKQFEKIMKDANTIKV